MHWAPNSFISRTIICRCSLNASNCCVGEQACRDWARAARRPAQRRSMCRAAGVLLALASCAALAVALPDNCGVAHYGHPTGAAQRLVQTRLGPGLADWTVRVPVPPSCRDATITGVEMVVCDADAPPNVSMSDALTARVHRPGNLSDSAAVNVTVHCVPPDASDTATLAPHLATTSVHHADTRSTYGSKELGSKDHVSTEIVTSGSEPNDVKWNEWTSTAATTTSTTTTTTPPLPPTPRVTAPPTVASTTEQVLPTPTKSKHSKKKSPHTLKVTIKITPESETSINDEQPQTYNVELPAVQSRQSLPAAGAAGGAGSRQDALYGALLQRQLARARALPLSLLGPHTLLLPRRHPLLYWPHF
ncbi:uncharacterized protein LOC110376997 isoform X1 [Helicoverpa armigera]|uniref:uncharacterized protein LOC110376997 isoform X1 n=2 Tax=Helicoverpa armigera TaxID=29058 RepID=UPI002111840F|nr:mucin-2 isoform X1 [Helicoverpa armigera]